MENAHAKDSAKIAQKRLGNQPAKAYPGFQYGWASYKARASTAEAYVDC